MRLTLSHRDATLNRSPQNGERSELLMRLTEMVSCSG
jgi:hypothetical protein